MERELTHGPKEESEASTVAATFAFHIRSHSELGNRYRHHVPYQKLSDRLSATLERKKKPRSLRHFFFSSPVIDIRL